MAFTCNLPRQSAAAFGLLIFATAIAHAADASPWDGDARTAARLIAGSQRINDTALRAGIQIRLKPGWHTYWRYPGDAGVPPQFDFGSSQNVKSVEVLWPAPQRLPEAGAVTIGYDQDFILPLRVLPQEGGAPVLLRLKLDYAICEKLCVPAEAKAQLSLNGGFSPVDPLLAAAEARIPKRVPLGEGQPLAIRSVRKEAGPPARVVVDVAAPGSVDLFAEGPSPEWALPVPAPIPGAPPGEQRFTFDLDGAPPGANYHNLRITLTAVAPEGAIEVVTQLE